MDLKQQLLQLCKNSIRLKIAETAPYKLCGTRFGGKPDVPPDFVWPTYTGESYNHVVKERPLTFLAQFNCRELAQYDTEHLLPDHGLLSFFYETDTQCWGFDPKDAGCARVFWFANTSVLSVREYPADMEDDFKFPMLCISLTQERSFPAWQDFAGIRPNAEDYETFERLQEALDAWEDGERSKLLGWPDIIQNSMAIECDLVQQGYYLGGDWKDVPKDVRQRAEETALERWLLLFQLDIVETDDFELMFGDCGRIYFYITKEDLQKRRFDRVWLILQCY